MFSDTNAGDLMPNGSHTVLITGELDTFSPPRVAHDLRRARPRRRRRAEVVILPGASHYDEVAPASPAFGPILPAIRAALGLPALSPADNKTAK